MNIVQSTFHCVNCVGLKIGFKHNKKLFQGFFSLIYHTTKMSRFILNVMLNTKIKVTRKPKKETIRYKCRALRRCKRFTRVSAEIHALQNAMEIEQSPQHTPAP